jgi:hypothetical protein
VLIRVVVASALAKARRVKLVDIKALHGKEVFVDGYNVLITVESMLEGCPVYLCDDGLLRDIRGIFRSYKPSGVTDPALLEIINFLASACPSRVEILLDQQISMSGCLASRIRGMMTKRDVPGTVRTAKDVDHQLKIMNGVIATSDGNVIDAAHFVVDIPGEIARRMGISPLAL